MVRESGHPILICNIPVDEQIPAKLPQARLTKAGDMSDLHSSFDPLVNKCSRHFLRRATMKNLYEIEFLLKLVKAVKTGIFK